MTRNCYTYLIGWSNLNIFYYGRQTRIGCDPTNIWKSYFTSSKHVENFRIVNGEPDIIQIRQVFGSDFFKCCEWETKVLRRLNVAKDKRFLNKTNNTSGFAKGTTGVAPGFNFEGEYIGLVDINDVAWGETIFGSNKFDTTLSQRSKQRNVQLVASGEHQWLGDKNPSKIKVKNGTHHFLRANNSRQRRFVDDLQRQKVEEGTHHWLSKKHAEEVGTRTKIAIQSGQHPFGQLVVCSFCSKIGQKASMARWHFDNCKERR